MFTTGAWPLRVTPLRLRSPSRDCCAFLQTTPARRERLLAARRRDDLGELALCLSNFIRLARPQASEVGMTLEGRRVGVAAVEDGVDRRLGLGAPR